MIFVDTSAGLALINSDDANHRRAVDTLDRIIASGEEMFTHSFALVESVSLIQRRMGLALAVEFHDTLTRLISVHWVSEQEHLRGFELLRTRNRRGLSLVDCVSFILMNDRRCNSAFAYDDDFQREGFQTLD